MQVLSPRHIYETLRASAQPQVLRTDLVLCYPRQFLPFALWLEAGTIVTHFDKAQRQEYSEPGLYLADEFLREKPLSFGILILKGSRIYSLSRAQLEKASVSA